MALSEKQQLVIDRFKENMAIDITHIGETVGVKPKTVYNWKCGNINGFRDALDEALRDKWEKMKYTATQTMENLAEEGDFKASQYILNYHGYEPSKKIEADVNAKVSSISIDIKCDDTED